MSKRAMNSNLTRFWTRILLTALGLDLLLGMSACAPQTRATPSPTASIPPTITSPISTSEAVTLEPSLTPTSFLYRSDFPDPAKYVWLPVISGLEQPLDIQNASDGSGRLFIVEKRGRILILQNDQFLPDPFLDIQNEVGSQHTEQGLLGLAFHPKYAENGLFFVNYTDVDGNTVVARFHVSADDPNRADPASEGDLLRVNQPFANHNGGGLAFGPDGYLYIGLGDGGSGGDPHGNGQNPGTYLGKMLLLNVDESNAMPEIWASGLRNPWRFSFDRLTGDLYIGDVGQDAWEEVNFIPAGTPAGLNLGWNFYEGSHPFNDQPQDGINFIEPETEYSHSEGCSVTGGYIYHGSALPEWQGVYFYGDYCSGIVWGLIQNDLDNWQSKVLFATGAQIATFGVDEAGEIYLTDYQSGSLLRLSLR